MIALMSYKPRHYKNLLFTGKKFYYLQEKKKFKKIDPSLEKICTTIK